MRKRCIKFTDLAIINTYAMADCSRMYTKSVPEITREQRTALTQIGADANSHLQVLYAKIGQQPLEIN